MNLNINSETSKLKEVLIGNSYNFKSPLNFRDLYDPTSLLNYLKGTYPNKFRLQSQLSKLKKTLVKYGVKVHELDIVDTNQIFARDLAFVIDDNLIISSILPDREMELNGLKSILGNIKNVIKLPKSAHIEGGDVIVTKDHVFIGYYNKDDYKNQITARTNKKAIRTLKELVKNKEVFTIELIKSSIKPSKNALHLDCCFQPVGTDTAILYKGGFKNQKDVDFLVNLFSEENIIFITKEEMYNMNSNVFSVSEKVIVSEKGFTRLNNELRKKGFIVEEINYSEIAKMEGLLRCSTMPLQRK